MPDFEQRTALSSFQTTRIILYALCFSLFKAKLLITKYLITYTKQKQNGLCFSCKNRRKIRQRLRMLATLLLDSRDRQVAKRNEM